jgi:nucleoside-diphosphate-sugar epimerase
MSILVTGAAGFLGSTLVRTLEAEGEPVVCLIRDWHRGGPQGYGKTLVFGDVTDRDVCRRVLADYEVTQVYHLAAQSIVSQCAEDPVTALNIAVIGTANILQSVRDAERPIRVVVSTSDKAYGHAPAPYTEETPFDARHAYEVSKACQDITARMFHHNFDVDVRIARCVNIYGPGDPNDSRLIPRTAQRLLRGEPPLLHEGAGSMRRQYVYIDDVVTALRFIMRKGSPGEAYCVGSPEPPMTVLDVMKAMAERCDVTWAPPAVKPRDSRFQEIEAQAVIDTKLRSLGWEPKVKLDEGINLTMRWYALNKFGRLL